MALLLDTAGWLAIESVTRQFSERLKADCETVGLRLTRRMGPGYTYRVGREMAPWGLEEQAGLFRVLGEEVSPVTVLESGAMLPKMSRSGLYGLRVAGPAPAGGLNAIRGGGLTSCAEAPSGKPARHPG